jgi:hypothetical protein
VFNEDRSQLFDFCPFVINAGALGSDGVASAERNLHAPNGRAVSRREFVSAAGLLSLQSIDQEVHKIRGLIGLAGIDQCGRHQENGRGVEGEASTLRRFLGIMRRHAPYW